ncbi:MAG TPA: hypothetical protein VFO67_11960 [Gemmatimonadales bacterium]|nr:hypothetical protein [Gemmatimonadales bacterium]
MAKVTLRFFGRFVYARSRGTSKIRVLAPRFDPGPFGPHQVFMSARRDQLVFRDLVDGALLTSARPAFKTVTDAAIEQSEIFVWDLSKLTVTYGVTGAVTIGGVETLDLREVEELAGRPAPTLDASAFQTSPSGKAAAIIEVSAGSGNGKRMLSLAADYTFVTETDAKDGDPNNDQLKKDPLGSVVKKKLADVVEFDVSLPGSQSRLTLTLTDSNGNVVGTVTVNERTTIGFSNLCTPLPRQHTYDLEFSRYYDLLKDPREAGQLIPREAPTPSLGEGSDCYLQAQIEGE